MRYTIAIIVIFMVSILLSGTLNAQENIPEESTMISIRKNSVFVEIGGIGHFASINYERVTLRVDYIGVSLKGGLTIYRGIGFFGGVNFFLGGPKHFFECSTVISLVGGKLTLPLGVGYRYQSPGGFLAKVGPINIPGSAPIWAGVSLGYSFY